MLHDPGIDTPPPEVTEITLSAKERDTLQRLAEEIAGIAALPIHEEKARLWEALNDLHSVRPMVWINEIPWNEMNVNDELTLKCIDPWARSHEFELRKNTVSVETHAGRYDRKRFYRVPFSDTQYRFWYTRGSGQCESR